MSNPHVQKGTAKENFVEDVTHVELYKQVGIVLAKGNGMGSGHGVKKIEMLGKTFVLDSESFSFLIPTLEVSK